jgi:hypothetical protein
MVKTLLYLKPEYNEFFFFLILIISEKKTINFITIISFICLATNCLTNIDQSKRENKK